MIEIEKARGFLRRFSVLFEKVLEYSDTVAQIR